METTNGTTTISGFHSHGSRCSHKVKTSPEVTSDFIRHKRKGNKKNETVSLLSAIWLSTIVVSNTVVGVMYLHPNLFVGPRKAQADVLSCFVLFQLIINYYKVSKTYSYYRGGSLEARQEKGKGDWSYCLVCKHERPARSTHCFDCKQCVLKRDHHCGIFRNCIGLLNTRLVAVYSYQLIEISERLNYNKVLQMKLK